VDDDPSAVFFRRDEVAAAGLRTGFPDAAFGIQAGILG